LYSKAQIIAVTLKIKVGQLAGRKTDVCGGETLLIGRAEGRAQFAVPHDSHMSGVQFAVECGPNGCLITARKDTRYLFCPSVRER